MNIGIFNNSVKDCVDTLKAFGLFKMLGIKSINNDGVSDEFKKVSIKNSYFKAYSTGLENYDYDILLTDQSYLQFEFKKNENEASSRYSFFHNPIEFIDYNGYVENQINQFDLNETIDEIGMLLEDEYGQFLSEQELVSNFTTIRYDLDYTNYRPLIHSVSHLHIGHNNNVRIPLDKIISPLKFLVFVIKHVYYSQWSNKVENDYEYIISLLNQSKIGDDILNSYTFTSK